MPPETSLAASACPTSLAPVGVHTGWNLRHPDLGAPQDELFLVGSTWWLHDLPSLDEHLAHTAAVLDELVKQRLILQRDVAALTTRAGASWLAAAQ